MNARRCQKLGSLLLVEDNAGDTRLLREMLVEAGLDPNVMAHVATIKEAEAHLADNILDIVLVDLLLPDARGLEGVLRVIAAAPSVPLVVLTGLDDELLALEALHEGAQDYLIKGQIDSRILIRALRYAIERKSLQVTTLASHGAAEVESKTAADESSTKLAFAAVARSAVESLQPSGAINGVGVRILLVEDLPSNQELACAILRRAGHLVDIANDGLEAVAAAELNAYDVILMDIQMPRMDGVSATRRIRDLPGPAGQTPIVAMTANAFPENVRAFRQAGMDGYVAKPFQQEELLFAATSNLRLRG